MDRYIDRLLILPNYLQNGSYNSARVSSAVDLAQLPQQTIGHQKHDRH